MSASCAVILELFPANAPRDVARWIVEGRTLLAWQEEFLRRRGVMRVKVRESSEARTLLENTSLEIDWIPETAETAGLLGVPVNVAFERVSFARALRNAAAPVPTASWIVRTREDLPHAATEWLRNEWVPLGSDYIKLWAHRIAAVCVNTPLTPNHLTLGTLLCALFVLGGLAVDVPGWRWFAPPLIIFAVVLDFADGRLARLKNAGSSFGGYLDSVVGDLTEDLCYLGVILHLALHDSLGPVAALGWGTVYFFGKYQAYLGLQYQNRYLHAPVAAQGGEVAVPLSSRQPLAYVFVVFEFTVVRYHLLALALLLRQPAAILIFYALHFNARWILRVALVTLRYLRDSRRR